MAVDPFRFLLEAAREGDDRSLAELVRRTEPAVRRACVALGSAGEADDLMQETYLRAVRSIDGYRGDAAVLTWLLAIARRVCADDVRARVRRRRLQARLELDHREEAAELPERIVDLLLALDPERREAFALTQLYGFSYEEAAAVAGCAVGTIRSRVARARVELVGLVQPTNAETLRQ